MNNGRSVTRGWPAKVAGFLAWSLVFAIIYGQSPLYTSNQNSKFLHGLARAGFGYLNNDWLANTIDPLPVFSGLVYITARVFPSGAPFYLYYGLIMGIYFFATVGIMDILFDIRKQRTQLLVFISSFLVLHSAALRFLLSKVPGIIDPFLLEGGVAGQRLLGQVLQPSTFAVFLVLSIYLFLMRKPYLSLVSMAMAIYFHSVYLLPGALLVLAYMWMTYREEGSFVKTFTLGAAALLLVSPTLIYTATIFRPSSSEVITRVNDILVDFRNPHHANLLAWWDWMAVIKVGIVMAALWIVRKTRLFPILAIVSLGAVILTILQLITNSDWLALIYPWRASVVLVPLSSSILLASMATRIPAFASGRSQEPSRWLMFASLILMSGLIVAGLARFQLESASLQASDSRPMMDFVSANKSPADTYLVPTDLRNFRLTTGAPIFINFKSVPYLDVDVLEWYDRVRLARFFYRDRVEEVDCDLLQKIHEEYGITHVVLDKDLLNLSCPQLGMEIYRDAHFAIYRIDI
jgi:hypothetical protein